MPTHKEFAVEDFEGIQVKHDWTSFDVLVAVCAQVTFMERNKLREKRSIRETQNKKSLKESQSHEQERPTKKLRLSFHTKETKTEEIINNKAKKPGGNRKNLSKAQKEELARMLAQNYDLPAEFREKITSMNQTGEAKLVIQKILFDADISTGLNRFSIPHNQLHCKNFLTDEEKSFIEQRVNNRLQSITVKVIEPGEGLPVGEANFTKWDMNKKDGKVSQSYVLNGGWKEIRSRNRLETDMFMQLWAFRDVEEALCFALVKIPIDLKKCLDLD